jgi:hypothetical protein
LALLYGNEIAGRVIDIALPSLVSRRLKTRIYYLSFPNLTIDALTPFSLRLLTLLCSSNRGFTAEGVRC